MKHSTKRLPQVARRKASAAGARAAPPAERAAKEVISKRAVKRPVAKHKKART